MGTNFYLFTQDKTKKPLLGDKANIVDDPDFGYKIHIAKTSCGWQPSFEAHQNISSVNDIKSLYDMGGFRIFDEYGAEYNWGAFEDRVVNFGSDIHWRNAANNEFDTSYADHEFTSFDGYRFTHDEFS